MKFGDGYYMNTPRWSFTWCKLNLWVDEKCACLVGNLKGKNGFRRKWLGCGDRIKTELVHEDLV
jgi:hypothetical protein